MLTTLSLQKHAGASATSPFGTTIFTPASRATMQWLFGNAPTTSSTCQHSSPEPTAQVTTIKLRRLPRLLHGIARHEQTIIHINSCVSLSLECKTIDYLQNQNHCLLGSVTWASRALNLSPTITSTTQAVSIRVHQIGNINICTFPHSWMGSVVRPLFSLLL
jgi:hypothetical protein